MQLKYTKHPLLLDSNQGVIPLVISSHKGRGANPPALEQARTNPDGMDFGSCAMYRPLICRMSDEESWRDGTASCNAGVLAADDSCVWIGEVFGRDHDLVGRALMTVLSDS